MEELALQQPELIGRDKELAQLKQHLEDVFQSQGSTIFISGEAGIGKTRLVTELIKIAESVDSQILVGWCLAESLEPLMPVKTALRDADLFHLVSGDPPPLVVSAYLIDESGLLIAKAEREELGLDSDIFAGMLSAVANFVEDSLSQMGKEGGSGLSAITYDKYTILIQSLGKISLAIVSEGTNSEFLIDDMKRALVEIDGKLDSWSGATSDAKEIVPKIKWFVSSGKYDGRFLVDDPKLKQENLFDNVLLGLQRESLGKPLLFFLDDLQWADPSTLNLLHYLARNIRKHMVLIVGTYRPEDIVQGWDGGTHQLEKTMQNMNREDLLEKLELERLNRASTENIIVSVLGKTGFERKFLDKIYRETEGTPFFVLEVVKLLVEDSAIAQDEEETWQLTTDIEKLDIPSKVYDVVKRRLDRLMKEQKEILECASVIGGEFSTDVLEKTAEMRKLTLLKNLNEIEKTHKLIHSFQKKYRFDHSKIREVLYNGIIDELKQEYHRIVGDTIAELHKDELNDVAGELAHHYFEAKDKKAGEYLIKAGDMAKERYANVEATRLYNNAISILKNDEELKKVYESLGDVYSLTSEFETAIENYNSAMEKEKDSRKKADIHRKIADVHQKKGDFEKSQDECVKGLKLIEGEDCIETTRLLSAQGWTYMKTGDYDTASKLLAKSLEIAEILDDKKEIAQAHHTIGSVHWSKGDYDNALKHLENAQRIREEIDDMKGLSASLNNIGAVYLYKGELDKALEYWEQSLEIKENIGDKSGIATALGNIGIVYKDRGELDKAQEFHEQSLEIREKIGDKHGIGATLGNIGTVYYARGKLDKALEYLEQSLEMLKNIGDKRGIASSLNNIGIVYKDRDEMDKALEFHEKSLEICLEIRDKRLSIHNYCGLAEVELELGDGQTALENVENALEISVEIGAKAEEGMSRRLLGTLHRKKQEWNGAIEEFEKARTILEEIGKKGELARLFYEYALLFKAKGEPDKAREHLERALEMFESMGMRMWVDKCEETLTKITKD